MKKDAFGLVFLQKHYTILGGALTGKRLIFKRFPAFLGAIFILAGLATLEL
ncbi:MAG: hypothetical protein FWH01_18290 [Oscillospiraceae bacterium]|nr:hypothetical protein [Oscillospiraceae bacterium]